MSPCVRVDEDEACAQAAPRKGACGKDTKGWQGYAYTLALHEFVPSITYILCCTQFQLNNIQYKYFDSTVTTAYALNC